MAKAKYDYLKTTEIIRSTIYPPFKNMIFYALKNSNYQIRFTHVSVPFEGKKMPINMTSLKSSYLSLVQMI